jgi:ribonuclease-3
LASEKQLLGYLQHRFQDGELLQAALTHRSAGIPNNERLEFLGDGVLNAIIGEVLYRLRPQADEGSLTRLRASLVRESTLAEIATELHLGDCLRLGSGEIRSGGFRRESILADALEAMIGAIYLDGGYEAARQAVMRWYGGRIEGLPDAETLKDAKTRLQEFLQGQAEPLPLYEVIEVGGEAHRQVFRVRCRLPDRALVSEGEGSSRRKAEQQAALRLLESLQRSS